MAILDQKTQKLISYYEVLNVSAKSSDDEIKAAYRRMAKRYHPDNNPQNRRVSELRFKLISDAYVQLQTREKRARYNRSLRMKAENDNASAMQRSSWFSKVANILFPHPHSSKRG